MPSTAIIGAGISGLAAAHTLRDAGYNVTILEKSRGVGGRTATRKRAGFIYDHGAQYIKSGSSISVSFITERFYIPDLVDIAKPVWTFDGIGQIQEGDPVQNVEPKWSYRSGINALAKRMAEGLDVRLETRIQRIEQTATGWQLFDVSGNLAGEAHRLLITIPATQAIELIQRSELSHTLGESICALLGQSYYN